MKTRIVTVTAALALATAPLAFAVSDGNHSTDRQHCSKFANESDHPEYFEEHCHSATVTVRDGDATNYHEYFGIGVEQTAAGQSSTVRVPLLGIGNNQKVDVWYDLGGPEGCQLYTFNNEDPSNYTGPVPCAFTAGASTAEPNPASGLHLYFGMDDNIDAGEHDSSDQVANGPSDGGGSQLNLDPLSVMQWLADAQANGASHVLRHPLPIADFGIGFCADGICGSLQTTQRAAAYPDGPPADRGAANYDGVEWDPQGCSGPRDGTDRCGTPNHPNYTLKDWNDLNGDPTLDPGIQIYEDPDAQGSPLGPYPLPGIYVGTCGVVIGGGPGVPPAPDSQFTNSAGQVVIDTGCHQGGLLSQ